MRRAALFPIVLFGGLLASCGSNPTDDGGLTIVVSSYPVEYAVLRVVGEHVDLRPLTPAGVEPHDFELTSGDVDAIEDAELVFYSGSAFQPAIAAAARKHDGIDISRGLVRGHDPHFWLDPTLMARALDPIEKALAKARPEEAGFFKSNAAVYKQDLAKLDADYAATLGACKRKEIVTAHAAFGYLARRYGLTQHAITGISPEGEPDPSRIADLSRLIKRVGVTTVFYENLVPRDFADTLAHDAGVNTAVLNPLETLTKRQLDAHEDYESVMRKNLAALADALDCAT